MIEIDPGTGGGEPPAPAPEPEPAAAPIEESPEQQFAAVISAPPEPVYEPTYDRDFAQAIAPDSTPWVPPTPTMTAGGDFIDAGAPTGGSDDDWSRQMADYQQSQVPDYGEDARDERLWQPPVDTGQITEYEPGGSVPSTDVASTLRWGQAQKLPGDFGAPRPGEKSGFAQLGDLYKGASDFVNEMSPITPVSYTHLTLPTICSV